MTKPKEEKISIGLKVSPAIRTLILTKQNGYMYLCSVRRPVSDRLHLRQCYHCQLLGHMSYNCPKKTERPVCLYCMGDHVSKECRVKYNTDKHSCAKCLSSKFDSDRNNSATHNSASLDCSVQVRELNRLASMTDFASKNVM